MAMTTGSLTITLSGESRGIGYKERIAKCVYATGLYAASGIPLPLTPSSWGFKTKLDRIELYGLASRATVMNLKMDQRLQRMRVFKPILCSLQGFSQQEVAAASGVSGARAFMVKVRGF